MTASRRGSGRAQRLATTRVGGVCAAAASRSGAATAGRELMGRGGALVGGPAHRPCGQGRATALMAASRVGQAFRVPSTASRRRGRRPDFPPLASGAADSGGQPAGR